MKTTLAEILAEREARAAKEAVLLNTYKMPLVVFTLNIPGEEKTFFMAERAFNEGIAVLKTHLAAQTIAIAHSEQAINDAGYSAFFCADTDAKKLKQICLAIEEEHPAGRLFDFDVFAAQGEKLSRSRGEGQSSIMGGGEGKEDPHSPRKCFVCDGDAFVCARSRAHTADEVRAAVNHILENFLKNKLDAIIGNAATRALLYELAVTPKPGLVDREHNGVHRDMDFFAFIDSTAAIVPYFCFCARAGFDFAARSQALSLTAAKPPSQTVLFESLRDEGKVAELAMRRATGGVNTHKGAIFSFGIVSAAFGALFYDSKNPKLGALMQLVRDMTKNLLSDFKTGDESRNGGEGGASPRSAPPSHGEALYAMHGITGIRGEVSAGFPSVCNHAYPLLCKLLQDGAAPNDAGAAALLTLLAHSDDTNAMHRAGKDQFIALQADIATFVDRYAKLPDNGGGGLDFDLIQNKLRDLDAVFLRHNISAGGCADLLAVSFFLYFLENYG